MRTKPRDLLEVEIRHLPDVPVFHEFTLFGGQTPNPDRLIPPTFRRLHERLTDFFLDPDSLLHIGVPELSDGLLTSYDCCIEFPLPGSLDEVKIHRGGRYTVLTVEKIPSKISSAIRTFQGDYLPDHGLVLDEECPTYETYFQDTLEYCVPIR